MALLQQQLQNPYWNLHDAIMTKSYQISKDMDIEMMPHAMYFTGDLDTVTKINHIPYQTIEYNDNGMFTAKLMNDTPIEIFIDNGATPSILPLCTYNKFPILHTYPKTESNTPIHTGGGLITSHFWLEIPLKLEHQTIQIKASVCDSECPYDLILGQTSMAQLSAWQDYASHKLYLQEISIPLTVRNNIRILPGNTNTSRSSIPDFMTKQDSIYSQTYYYRQRHCTYKTIRPRFTTQTHRNQVQKQPLLH